MSIVNWAKLVAQGRAKAIGIPWTKEEELARRDGVEADDIRTGKWKEEKEEPIDTPEGEVIETPSPLDNVKEIKIDKPVKKMIKDDLIKLAKTMKLEFDAEEWGSDKGNIFEVGWNDEDGSWDTGGGLNSECKEFKTVIGNIYKDKK